ncbi:MAG TPA: EI24 domain-containing protein, partial [Thermodesulfobacteriota bacterium]|nr:EI24 domain-containing protein [Thermodesulfobacteriota bacterium]
FNDLISEKVERIYAGTGYEEAFSLKTVLADILRSIRVEIGKLLVYLAGLMLLLSLNLVPLVGSVFSGSLIMVYTLYFLGWEYIDYSMERWKYSLRLKLKTATANGSAFLGFGAGASLLLFIPLANLMAIPVCAIGATLLFCDLRKNHRLPDST